MEFLMPFTEALEKMVKFKLNLNFWGFPKLPAIFIKQRLPIIKEIY